MEKFVQKKIRSSSFWLRSSVPDCCRFLLFSSSCQPTIWSLLLELEQITKLVLNDYDKNRKCRGRKSLKRSKQYINVLVYSLTCGHSALLYVGAYFTVVHINQLFDACYSKWNKSSNWFNMITTKTCKSRKATDVRNHTYINVMLYSLTCGCSASKKWQKTDGIKRQRYLVEQEFVRAHFLSNLYTLVPSKSKNYMEGECIYACRTIKLVQRLWC
jgi:hypothetical protein